MQKNFYNQRGYVALMSAIIVTILLVAITVSLGLSAFFGRFNIVDSESKERSIALAEACVDRAMLKVGAGDYSAETIDISGETCDIIALQANTPSSNQTTIQTQACVNKSVTNLKVVVNNDTFDIVTFEDLPNFSPNISCM